MVSWKSDECAKAPFPSPDLPVSLTELTRIEMSAVLQTLRYVAPYEGGTDYTFERRFISALWLMFYRYSVVFVRFVWFLNHPLARHLTYFPGVLTAHPSGRSHKDTCLLSLLVRVPLLCV